MGKHLVLVGGGHAHMTALKNLGAYVERGHDVTLISPSEFQYYSGMGPGLLGGTYSPQQVRFHVGKMAVNRGAEFVEDRVTRIDRIRHVLSLESGKEVTYDVASFNTGSSVPTEGLVDEDAENVFPVKPIVNLHEARRAMLRRLRKESLRLVVVGGGPAGVEMAGNLWRLADEAEGRAEITLVTGSRVLPGSPEKVRRLALESLGGRGIDVLEHTAVQRILSDAVALENGRSVPYDLAFVAVGTRPSTLFRDSGLETGPDGGLLVNRFLQSVSHPALFGGGDCICFHDRHLARVGVYAVRQNPVLFKNLMAALEDGELQPFKPQTAYLLIMNMGDGRGIYSKKGLTLDGRLAFRLKDHIDRRFMRRFQVSGELDEPFDGVH